ncbi:hypothetical protein AC625_23625 [Peribacillus loiseleuriae]|uniref:Uncharacterized protein n=1 Tax=Peribacillus loiseleuriae TaxID=1679170 RepID=A0A0K9GZV9_9BACI|nr:hypothetical protein AC625_23625 [Peribacillus loiseleuriae]
MMSPTFDTFSSISYIPIIHFQILKFLTLILILLKRKSINLLYFIMKKETFNFFLEMEENKNILSSVDEYMS